MCVMQMFPCCSVCVFVGKGNCMKQMSPCLCEWGGVGKGIGRSVCVGGGVKGLLVCVCVCACVCVCTH